MNINFYGVLLNKFLMSIFFIIGGFLLYTFLSLVIDRITHKIDPDAPYGLATFDQRVFALSGLLKTSARYIMAFLVLILILLQFNAMVWAVTIISGLVILTGTFWFRDLFQDLTRGFFIFFENHYQAGDEVQINGVKGTVEKITIRSTFLRGQQNEQHIFPNHLIKEVINLSKGTLKNQFEIGFLRENVFEKVKPILDSALENFFQKNLPGLEEKPQILELGKFDKDYYFVKIELKTQIKNFREISNAFKKFLVGVLEAERIFFIINN